MNTESPMWDRGLLERATRHHKRPTTRKVEPGLAGNVVKRKFTPQHLLRQHSRKCSEELQQVLSKQQTCWKIQEKALKPQVERSTSSEGSNSTDDKRDNNFISELM
ncbi:hypothetical protein SELMODRAFT_419705 [Selaginella moellendorffii]|uniref:Uncharacterized protein n=1 Tax=Selaginella moellendorffii TaxID=88036 RepID=D8S9S9_SELML|nr:hypothetical protein SELMODRAFT_419705 [Selaginella moellendorffii]